MEDSNIIKEIEERKREQKVWQQYTFQSYQRLLQQVTQQYTAQQCADGLAALKREFFKKSDLIFLIEYTDRFVTLVALYRQTGDIHEPDFARDAKKSKP